MYFSEFHNEQLGEPQLTLTTQLRQKCGILFSIISGIFQVSISCSEAFFVLRTYALWNNNKIILVAMLSTLLAVALASIGSRFTNIASSHITTSAILGIPGCYWSSPGVQFLSFVLLFMFQLVLASLTLVRVIQSWRTARSHLYAVLVKHNMFYYACGLFFSGMNAIVPKLFSDVRKPPNALQYDRVVDSLHTQSAYYAIFEDFQVFILAILATRMHLHLWHIDRDVHGSDALIYVSMSDMSPADLTV
ncbi:uncharacterized protein BJ212DRAFT_1482205 [Suillus subaureus]|uniref:Uncharacterized protein n=1 Tax=Suillus subaureus TaxID=48587 RepID=A0A9P7JC32_9AGAM|nr:uncharacterized protein BJ212DRAFT_1482205 [Suillus subaureus]KAG1813847.1 hypothetical protein BJ212DRAFT_1482205 [Suillus subaureus]